VICYAVGWTQHTTGVQTIRAATILQSLGNIGRPGGGILALRGHASIQGSTDIPTLYNLLPGYLNTPSALKNHDTLADYIETEISPTSYWYHFPKFIVTLLTAWFGAAATRENDYGFGWLPRNVGDHSHLPMFVAMSEGKIHGFKAMGQNPAVGGQNASFQRRALAKLDWLVVRDLYETETATFWIDSPEAKSGETKPEDIFRARSFMRVLSPSANVSSRSERAVSGERSFFSGMMILVQISASVSGVTVVCMAIFETGCQDYDTITISGEPPRCSSVIGLVPGPIQRARG